MAVPTRIRASDEELAWGRDIVRHVTPYTLSATVALGVVGLLACLPWVDPWMLVPVAGSCVVYGGGLAIFQATGRLGPSIVAWFVSQGLIALALVIDGRGSSGQLCVLLFMSIGGAAGSTTPLAIACTVYTGLLMVLVGLGVNADGVARYPPELLVPLALLISTQILAAGVRKASIAHRSSALIDSLTGLQNRAALDARAEEIATSTRRGDELIGVLVVDVDEFKSVNDGHGHARGDAVLVAVATRLRAEIRSYDAAYRLGGDEFVILAPGLDDEQIEVLGERVRDAVRARELSGLPVRVSVGTATMHAPATLMDAIAEADATMYAAKPRSRTRVSA